MRRYRQRTSNLRSRPGRSSIYAKPTLRELYGWRVSAAGGRTARKVGI